MATTIAQLTLTSSDLLSDSLEISTVSTLTGAGNSTGVTQSTGLARKTTLAASAAAIQAAVLYRAGDYTTNGSNKVYVKNLSNVAAEFFTVTIDQEELGRLYAGDWMFMPWNATSGTKRVGTVTIAATWAVGDTWEFDGITMTSAGTATAGVAAQIDALNYPNWTTTYVATESTIIFTERYASSGSYTELVTGDGTLATAGNGTANISSAAVGSKSESDISVRPSVHTAMTYETLLIHE
tara:strand:+ start:16 stop:732 length:717 start_codon:yes stop_codon:yes gene_type:complete